MPAVAELCSASDSPRVVAADPHRGMWLLDGFGLKGDVGKACEIAMELRAVFSPEGAYHPEVFVGPDTTIFETHTQCPKLVLGPPRGGTEYESASERTWIVDSYLAVTNGFR